MSSTTRALPPNHRSAAAFEQYVSGHRALDDGVVFLLESGDAFETVRRAAEPGDVIFAPDEETTHDTTGVTVIGYHGRFQHPGDEVTLDGRHTFELQDYLAAPFISIVGLTVVRQGSAEGLAAYFADADTARRSGVFVEQLLHRAVLLDSRASFGTPDAASDLVRVHVTADGALRDGPDGHFLGEAGTGRCELLAAAESGEGAGRAFARIIEQDDFDAAMGARPWMTRYAVALDLLRHGEPSAARPQISGFGGYLASALHDTDLPDVVDADAPFLLWDDDGDHTLIDPRTRRRFRLGREAAVAVECLIAAGEREAATDLFAVELGATAATSVEAVAEIDRRFAGVGIDLTAFGRGAS
ncbi:MAG: hypothetical protein J7484_03845 [Microbacterium sp.]|nr:hypothetical protein [Microbacterium sp.]